MSDFATQFKAFNETLGQAAKGVFNKLDQWSFKMLVDCLKSDDYDAVSSAVDQLVKEKKPLSIPPLFFVSRAHPNKFARQKAATGLREFGHGDEIEQLTSGKSTEDGTKALIERFGNYKS